MGFVGSEGKEKLWEAALRFARRFAAKEEPGDHGA